MAHKTGTSFSCMCTRIALRSRSFFLPSVAVLLASLPSHAETIYLDAIAGASASFGGTTQNYGPPEILQTSPIIVGPIVESVGSNTAKLSGSVHYGSISANLSASADPVGGADAMFNGEWHDELTVTSSTLAPGTPVNLLFTLTTIGTLSCSTPANPADADAVVNSSLGFLGLSLSYNAIVGNGGTPCPSGSMAIDNVQTGVWGTTVGSVVDFGGAASWEAVAIASQGSAEASADPPSATTYIDPLTAGVTLVAGSGHSYSTPAAAATPEPGGLVLLGTGLLCVGLLIRAKGTWA